MVCKDSSEDAFLKENKILTSCIVILSNCFLSRHLLKCMLQKERSTTL